MSYFSIIAGWASILSFIISIISLCMVNNVRKNVNKSINVNQDIKAKNVENSTINQAGKNLR